MSVWIKIKKAVRYVLPVGYRYMERKFAAAEAKHQKQLKELERKLVQENFRRNQKEIEKLRDYVGRELDRRQDWEKRKIDTVRQADGRPIWIIKCPAPDDERKIKWGDYAYAGSLKRYLERMGMYVEVDLKEDWNREVDADVVLVLRGYHFYRPDRRKEKTVYIMWNISHPEMVEPWEYELYDAVCIASRHYAAKLQDRLKVPVFPLLQCTDTELFCPEGEAFEDCRDAYLFIGNSRGVARSSVVWPIEKNIPLYIVGSDWYSIIPDHMDQVKEKFVLNEDVAKYYRAAKVTLNDHWQDMLEQQFVNNRIFDALACGLPVITDYCEELKDIFPEGPLYYGNQEEFDECLRQIEENYEAVKAKAAAQREKICAQYSFACRAKELAEIARQLSKSREA